LRSGVSEVRCDSTFAWLRSISTSSAR
jgi:hypothetical protein